MTFEARFGFVNQSCQKSSDLIARRPVWKQIAFEKPNSQREVAEKINPKLVANESDS